MKKVTLSTINKRLPRVDWLQRNYLLDTFSGITPKGAKRLRIVFADLDNGDFTGIRVYAYGDAMEARHWYGIGNSANVTDIIENWMRGEYDRAEVCRLIQQRIADQEA
jgi:hypothetical protein